MINLVVLFLSRSMLRLFFGLLFTSLTGSLLAQQQSIAVGVFSGFTVPFSMDTGMDQDQRYKPNYRLKGAPFGVAVSMDFEGYGFVITPGVYTIGQNYFVVNSLGGQDGTREMNLRFASIPVAFKLHLIDLSFFRISATASVTPAFLIGVEDILSHSYTKLEFPSETHPLLAGEPYATLGYEVQYDGVLVPEVQNFNVSTKEDYNKVQLFAGLGLRSDWDVSNNWRVSFDVRVNYGIFDPRTDAYLNRIQSFESVYDFDGRRNEMFAQLNIGIARFLEFDKNDKERAKKLKKGSKPYIPSKRSAPKRRSPRG